MIAIMNYDAASGGPLGEEYKRLSVEQWLNDNLRRDAFGNEAVSDRTLVNLIIEKGAKAIREILRQSRWHEQKPNTNRLYVSLQEALKHVDRLPTDSLYAAQWQQEEFSNIPLDVGTAEEPPECSLEITGDVQSAKNAYKHFVARLIATDSSEESVAEAYEQFIAACSEILPGVSFHYDLTDALRRFHQNGDLTAIMTLNTEFAKNICYPANEIFSPIMLSQDSPVEYYEAHILGNWRKHDLPIGTPGFSADTERYNMREKTVFTQAAFTVERFFFNDVRCMHAECAGHYRFIQSSTEANPFWYALRTYMRLHDVDVAQYLDTMEKPRYAFEESEHMYDQNCIELYKAQHPEMEQHRAIAEVLVAPRAGLLPDFWTRNKDSDSERRTMQVMTEFPGQLGGLIRNMKAFIDQEQKAMAFSTFLNQMGIMVYLRDMYESIKKEYYDNDAHEAEQGLLQDTGGYLLVADMLLRELDSHGSALKILQKSQESGDHPADVALLLLEEAYTRNSPSLAERKALLGLS